MTVADTLTAAAQYARTPNASPLLIAVLLDRLANDLKYAAGNRREGSDRRVPTPPSVAV